jgi:hypothetical protein
VEKSGHSARSSGKVSLLRKQWKSQAIQ